MPGVHPRSVRRYAALLLILIFGILLGLIGWRALRKGRVRAALRLNGPDAIDQFETIKLGGLEQSMLIRGQHRANPVLLYLHGGPGTPMYSWYRVIGTDTGLEEHFVMVYWEQRGVNGRRAGAHPQALRITDFVNDGCQLVTLLQRRFKMRPALLGISWGSFLGIKMLGTCSSSIRAYIGSGQVVDFSEADQGAASYLRSAAARASDQGTLALLDRLGFPPWSFDHASNVHKALAKYGAAEAYTPEGKKRLPGTAELWEAPEYSLLDLFWGVRNPAFVLRSMWSELHRSNLNSVASVPAPLLLLEGRHDRITPPQIARRFFDTISAPKKEWMEFPNSAHVVPVDEPLAFGRAVVQFLASVQLE